MKQFLQVNGITLCIDDTCETDKKPLLLYHGLTSSKEAMYFMRDMFRDEYRIICVDERGHGESDHPLSYTLHDHAMDVHGLIGAMGLEKVDILGYSMGSYVAMAAAEEKSDDIDHLILLATKGYGTTSSVERIIKEQGLDIRTVSQEQMQKIMMSCMFAPASLKKLMSGEMKTPFTDAADVVVLNEEEKAAESRSLANFNNLEHAGRITCKTLVIAGEYDGINPKELGKEVCEAIPGARYVEISDTGHCLPYEKPDEFKQTVLDFLKQ